MKTLLATPGRPDTEQMVLVPEGEFLMGSEEWSSYPADGEGPVRRVRVAAFFIDVCAVSNEQFARFVEETGYITECERFGWSFVFAGLLADGVESTRGVARAPWWRQLEGASWRHPEGPGSDLQDREDHPVVHVTWNDAEAFADTAGKRLPTEAEWEYAARGGLEQQPYPWGDALEPDGEHRMNVWQGAFPRLNTCADGYYGTCPVDAFPPNDYGLHNMTGNTWEWCVDWFSRDFRVHDRRTNPRGPQTGTHKSARGGSYLSHVSHSRRYRVSARSARPPDWSSGNLSFRCAGWAA
jgi:formylglycine-generating enzyme required for sulfatase activity